MNNRLENVSISDYKLGRQIHKVRKSKGVTQEQLAEKIGTGIDTIPKVASRVDSVHFPEMSIPGYANSLRSPEAVENVRVQLTAGNAGSPWG